MMITHEKASTQAIAPKTWDKPTAQAQVNDYIDESFQPKMVVVDKDTLPDGKVWLLVKPLTASWTQEWIIKPEQITPPSAPSTTQPENTLVEQPVSLDYPSCKLEPAPLAQQEYQKGTWWGKQDASSRREALYTQASCPHSTGYLDAYNQFTQINQQFQQPPKAKPIDWRVVFAPDWDWDWYVLLVGGNCIGKYCSWQKAESAAQKYIAAEQARLEHRELVMAAYPG